jgi:Uma2 family endonuclease
LLHSPGLRHQHPLSQILFSLWQPVREQKRGLLLGGCGVILAPDTIVEPDILFVSRERRHLLGKEYIEGPPDLIGEVISPTSGRIDRLLRRNLYAKSSVRHYWLVHPGQRSVRAYTLGADGAYELIAEAHDDEAFAAPPFTDLPIQLTTVWDLRLP